MNRPRCGSCPFFDLQPGSDVLGLCYGKTPEAVLTPGRTGGMMVNSITPPVEKFRPCCPTHPRAAAYAEWVAKTVTDDPEPPALRPDEKPIQPQKRGSVILVPPSGVLDQ